MAEIITAIATLITSITGLLTLAWTIRKDRDSSSTGKHRR